ncbi:cell wall hydrolase [Sphingomonas sp. AP4-R1]|uniref:cell wall hydrolase n=1 Tax=Sphingomonas sp. AP4-R1 TaxID=2735134 RepID=UPI0014934E31|nr:cell wall hydrolase [Sphingomonas sp. AP4-R1]QJU58814.1 cell wall hydrolase [Sphingomonas sp. AP4-R1]
MPAIRRTLVVSAGALIAAAVVILPASTGLAAERIPMLSYDFTGLVSSAPSAQDIPAEASAPVAPVQTEAKLDEASVTCLAKVVRHEAANQPRSGQVAVAQTLVNRMKVGGRFGSTICEVANQPGQYFNTHAYRPAKDETWEAAVDVARDTLSGEEDEVVPGATFYRASYAAPTTFFRSLQRVAAVGDHVFYR